MKPLYSTPIVTAYGEKRMDVYACDILDFDEPVDILTTSAYVHSYAPSPRTVFESMNIDGHTAIVKPQPIY